MRTVPDTQLLAFFDAVNHRERSGLSRGFGARPGSWSPEVTLDLGEAVVLVYGLQRADVGGDQRLASKRRGGREHRRHGR